MRGYHALLLSALLVAGVAGAGVQGPVKRARYVDTTYGLSIDFPTLPPAPPKVAFTRLMMTAPEENGFSDNININVMESTSTLKAQKAETLNLIRTNRYRLNSVQDIKIAGHDACLVDYQANIKGRMVRWLMAATVYGKHSLAMIGTMAAENYPKIEPLYRSCLNGLRLEDRPNAKGSFYGDPQYHFSVAPPQFPGPGPGAVIRLLVVSSPLNGSSAEMMITVENLKTTREEYKNTHVPDLQKFGATIHSVQDKTVSGRDAFLTDYEVTSPDSTNEGNILTIIDKDRVFLVGCSARKDLFKKYQAEFRSCLQSFKLTH
jgi:hypothetical protein